MIELFLNNWWIVHFIFEEFLSKKLYIFVRKIKKLEFESLFLRWSIVLLRKRASDIMEKIYFLEFAKHVFLLCGHFSFWEIFSENTNKWFLLSPLIEEVSTFIKIFSWCISRETMILFLSFFQNYHFFNVHLAHSKNIIVHDFSHKQQVRMIIL